MKMVVKEASFFLQKTARWKWANNQVKAPLQKITANFLRVQIPLYRTSDPVYKYIAKKKNCMYANTD